MRKKRRFFWSYDAEKTERWLTEEAGQGWRLNGLNRWTRSFSFEEGPPETAVYRITFDKRGGKQLPSALADEGWQEAAASGHWRIAENSHPKESIRLQPSREGLVRHNRLVMLVFFGLSFYFGGILLANLSMVLSSLQQDGYLEVEPSPLWSLTFIFFAGVLVTLAVGVYSIVKITRTNASLEQRRPDEHSSSLPGADQKEKHAWKQSGKRTVRVKLGWMYEPDRLEKWLESMERKGFHLARVHKIGTLFSFVKRKPERYCYRADYQSNPPESYFSIHRDAGWELVFSSLSSLEKWVLWRRKWEEGEERPSLYSDEATKTRQAKRLALTYSVLFSPLVLIYAFNLSVLWNSGGSSLPVWMSAIVLVMFSSFIFKLWAYYRRVKKSVAV